MVKATGGYIDLEFIVRKEGDQYSSWYPDLDIASCGDTPEEAVENLTDAPCPLSEDLGGRGLGVNLYPFIT